MDDHARLQPGDRLEWNDETLRVVEDLPEHVRLRLERELTDAERFFGRRRTIRLHKRLAYGWLEADEVQFEVLNDSQIAADGGAEGGVDG